MGNYTDYDLTHNSAHYMLMIISPFLGFILGGALYSLFKLSNLLLHILYAHLHSFRTGPITTVPKVPKWLKQTGLLQKTSPFQHYRMQCFSYEKLGYLTRSRAMSKLTAISSMVYGTKRMFGRTYPNVHVPQTTCTFSIPRRNFKCSSDDDGECTRFEPIDGMAEGSRLEYQMLGDDMAQVTYYVEDDGKRYPAGLCIYAEDAKGVGWKIRAGRLIELLLSPDNHYEPSRNLTEESITIASLGTEPIVIAKNRVGAMTRFRLMNDGKQWDGMPTDAPTVPDPRPDLTAKRLKVRFCKSQLRPVLVGRKDGGGGGGDVHFEWNQSSFQTVHCETCRVVEEVPPPYHTLEMSR